jgi:hypothetical protein
LHLARTIADRMTFWDSSPSSTVRISKRAAVLAAMVAATLTGCYHYVPLDRELADAGSEVRVYLTADGTRELGPRLGMETIAVAGRVESSSATDISMVVAETTRAFGGGTVQWVGEKVSIPRGAVARTERRTLDRQRTITVTAAAFVATVVAVIGIRAARGGAAGDDGSGTPPPISP